MNLYSSASYTLFISGSRGSTDGAVSWENWTGRCAACYQVILEGGGLFCADFATPRLHWKPCQKAWCGKCYRTAPNDSFPVKRPLDEDGVEVGEVDDQYRFVRGRNGDHLLTPFQCDLCHFRNCNLRDPDPTSYANRLQLTTMRRANLDACWIQESTTVARNLTNCRRILAAKRSLGFTCVFPLSVLIPFWKPLVSNPLVLCFFAHSTQG